MRRTVGYFVRKKFATFWRLTTNPWIVRLQIVLGLLLIVCIGWVNYLDSHQIGIAYNQVSGKIWMQGPGGFYVTGPWVRVSRIDTRPMRVAVESSGRGYSGKLVQFQPEYWREFVQVEGFRYWWWANRLSYNNGHQEQYRGMRDILRGYTYSPKVDDYSFIIVLEEYAVRE